MKSYRAIIGAVAFLSFLTSCTETSKIDVAFLRDQADKASAACAEYYSALHDFGINGGGDDAIKDALGTSISKLRDELGLMNSSIMAAVSFEKATGGARQGEFDTLMKISRVNLSSDIELEEFLTVTVKSECAKWKAFAKFSDSQITDYFETPSNDAQTLSARVCDAIKIEAEDSQVYGQLKINQCESQNFESEWKFIIGLNDWLEWIDLDNPPSGDELGNLLFDAPLGLLVEGFRDSGVKPSEFGTIAIFIADSESTVYEIAPEDLEETLDSKNTKEALIQLREKLISTELVR